MVINPIFDTTITHDPNAAKIEGTIDAAIRTFEASILDSVTVNIKFVEMTSGLVESTVSSLAVPYTSYLAALKSHATTAAAKSSVLRFPQVPTTPSTAMLRSALRSPTRSPWAWPPASPGGRSD